MSDKAGKTGLSSGASWSLFSENTAFEETDMIVERLGNSSDVTRLRPEDITKFGACPSRQAIQLTTCRECNRRLLLSSLQHHYEFKHAKLLSTVKPSPLKRCIPNSKSSTTLYSKTKVMKGGGGGGNAKNFIRIEEVNPNETNVKIEEVPITIPHFEKKSSKLKVSKLNLNKIINDKQSNIADCSNVSASCSPNESSTHKTKSSLSKKSIQKMKEKEFDPDRHCGVWVAEAAKNCTRSLTCKTHALSLRRQVPGRSKDFDELLAEHRARVRSQENNNSNVSSSSTLQSLNRTPVHSPFGFEKINFPTVTSESSTNHRESVLKTSNGNLSQNTNINNGDRNDSPYHMDYVTNEALNTSNLPSKQHHPKPLKLNNFGGRRTQCNCSLFTRRMDHFRSATASMLAKYNCNITDWKQTKDDKEKKNLLGPKPALQDPLQNGIIFKQKTQRKASGLKRHLSLNEVQGIHNDSAKRRNSTDINIVQPFTNNTGGGVGVQQANRLSKLSSSDQFSKKKDLAKANNLDVSVIDEFFAGSIVDTPSPSEKNLLNSIETVDLTKPVKTNLTQVSHDVDTLPMPTLGSAVNHNIQGVTSVFSLQSNNNKIVSAAPNITITQGMIVSLPNAATVLRNNTMRPSTETSLQSTPQNLTLKQILNKDQNNLLLTISNNETVSPHVQDNTNKTYSISYSSFDQQEPAPNVTVTASLSLSGVLQGHAVTTSPAKQHQIKRVNSKTPTQTDSSRLLQQLIVQQQQQQHHHHNHHNHEQQRFDGNLTTAGVVTQTTNNQRVVAQQQQNTMSCVTGGQSIKPLQRIHIQQLNQTQTSQPFISAIQHNNANFSQQILPKLPTLPQNFSTQLVSQATTVNQLQQQPTQQHGGTLS